jgi:ATP-dependent protease HslVU (ClpYQ) peptidase subunit
MRLSKDVQRALDECGQPWRIDKGSRHLKIIVNEKFVGILPIKGSGPAIRADKNIVAQIRRAAKGLQP